MQMTTAFVSTALLGFIFLVFIGFLVFSCQLSAVSIISVDTWRDSHMSLMLSLPDSPEPPHTPAITGMPMTTDTLPIPPRLIRSVTFLVSDTLQWNSNEPKACLKPSSLTADPKIHHYHNRSAPSWVSTWFNCSCCSLCKMLEDLYSPALCQHH